MHVLAIDDSRTIRDMVRLTLEREGIESTMAVDGLEGLEILKAMDPQPDAILTDVNMPRLDGFGFIEAVRALDVFAGIPILVLTTEGAKELKQRARNAGATGWIVKPFDPARLVVALRTVTGLR
ncbi:response regulator [Jannaschia seohaensis]|uniref:Two-component system chemotaxis response regulator CheY n=1 Tax=Jannaschia seohaensis TaxID=475081 RepID=A0A2Y9C2E4_9RHOB|nr:response regulator [Jannaschia seohaensis]PWJ15858.1 two-component system chemotaxis response regulator CheY [Jannaschia seohaensis]SSA49562.1 two-component system, chemotaxis family, response regulator CheY [Jannaschia seohaensis]